MKNAKLCYSILENNIILFSNASIMDKSIVGNNVIGSSAVKVVNSNILTNSIVFGESPNLTIKQYNQDVIEKMINNYWR